MQKKFVLKNFIDNNIFCEKKSFKKIMHYKYNFDNFESQKINRIKNFSLQEKKN